MRLPCFAHFFYIAPHALGPLDAACTVHRSDPSGLALMRRVLFYSFWFGSQAFYLATEFNANIGAWNTASVSNMDEV